METGLGPSNHLQQLWLMHLADSALPIGALAHSFDLETLTSDGTLTTEQLESFLRDYLTEAGVLDGITCRAGHKLGTHGDPYEFEHEWAALNMRCSALKPARESRAASGALGRRFLLLVLSLQEHLAIRCALETARRAGVETHFSASFGLAGGALGLDEDAVVLAYLQQALTGLVSACQRLLPLGQSRASQILWRLKAPLIAAAEQSRATSLADDGCSFFAPLVEIASMRHPTLPTRLFIS